MHRSPHEIGFRVGTYDRTRPLIIDPVLSYSTYLGGSGYEEGNSIAVDATGAVYVTGHTASTDFPTVNAAQPSLGGSCDEGIEDIYVAKLTPDGTALVYATYIGGSDRDAPVGIAIDSAGAAYVIGFTLSHDFPTENAFQPANSGSYDAVVAKLSADGSRLIYSTYLGGESYEFGHGIAVDLAGAAYVAGSTGSADFPTVNAIQSSNAASSQDAFVAKLAPDGSALLYSTYLGGAGEETATGIAVDSLGAAYVFGDTTSNDFPLMNPFQAAFGGFRDAFAAKLAPDGASLIYSTFLGGSSDEQSYGMAIDASGAAYVTGYTDSTDFSHDECAAAAERRQSGRIRGEDRARGTRDDLWDLSRRVWIRSWLRHRRGHRGSGPCYRAYRLSRFSHDECAATGFRWVVGCIRVEAQSGWRVPRPLYVPGWQEQ